MILVDAEDPESTSVLDTDAPNQNSPLHRPPFPVPSPPPFSWHDRGQQFNVQTTATSDFASSGHGQNVNYPMVYTIFAYAIQCSCQPSLVFGLLPKENSSEP